MATSTRAYIALGSNLDNPESQLRKAVRALRALPHGRVAAVSPVYQNPAIGPGTQPDYLNAVVALDTTLSAVDLLHALQHIESDQGRRRDVRWGARTLDLDIALFGNEVITTAELQIPHPRLCERNFVLRPLLDIAPALMLPDGSPLRSHLDSSAQAELTRLPLSIED
jgi:2-amino-4-hydroxy-6-hydroxymethyldihydropteridine diphosphokinase